MARVIFYEKPGCGTNGRQKRLLEQAGHEVMARSLLSEPWTGERLAAFFGDMPVPARFNPAAPGIKSGAVDPRAFSAEQALALMLEEPLFIRRPLLEVEGVRCAGFEGPLVARLLGTGSGDAPQGCSRPEVGACPTPAEAAAP
ncbi:hypothetical protein DFO45_0748 [Azorhizobium sp. AG788]|uniref:arsenate reductase family protein n=1 Tax=Azorhizobium sp. AG788 TaxID=2183897 RepID=UPI00105EB1D5|nr:arsenate reductase family protein [Azorhizobium sp. AG788]TDU01231.1 hypothetical protein DFO45_0748 [Azorhizobium sp. AG788]